MEVTIKNPHRITRFEVIDQTGRAFTYRAQGSGEVTLSQQDGETTLKVFLQSKVENPFQKRVEELEKALLKCYRSMEGLNDGGFGPLTRKEDIDAMRGAADLLHIEY